MNEELKNVSKAILEEPVILEMSIAAQNRRQKYLQKWGWFPKQKELAFHPVKLGSLIKISGIMVGLGTDLFDMENLLESNYKLIHEHGYEVAKVIAIAVVNSEKDPSDRLIRLILHNLSAKELAGILSIVLKQMDVSSFMKSIISIKGMNLLQKMSPNDQGSQIASGQ